MDRVILIDVARGGLTRLEKDLVREGVTVERLVDDDPRLESLEDGDIMGIVVNARCSSTLKAIRSSTVLEGVPVLVWYPAQTSRQALDKWARTGAFDLLYGPVDAKELLARLSGISQQLRAKLPWLQQAITSLFRISRTATSREDDFTVLSLTAREMEKIFPGVRCTILMIPLDRSRATVITQGNISEPLNIALDLAKYPEIRKMLETLKPVFIKDVKKHPLMSEVHELVKAKSLFSVLAVPIFYRDQVIGLIMLRTAERPRTFDRVEVNLCEMVAQSTAIALRSIRLSREVAEEVAKTRKAEEVARKKISDLARLETLFDHASDGIVVVDRQGKVRGVNVNFTRLTGYTKEDVAGRNIEELIFPAHGQAFSIRNLIKKKSVKAEATRRSTQILHVKDGSRRHVAARIESLPKRKEWLISLHDVTEEKELDEALRRTKDFLENVINSSMDAIIAADMTGTIILFNQAAEQISGYQASEVVGKMNITGFYAPGVARDVMRKLRSDEYGGKGKLEACYNALVSSSGEEIPINMSAAIVYEEGREVASVGVFQDLRERIKIEKELREAQESLMSSRQKETLMALSGAASHELNQPLTSIMGYAELLKRVEKTLSEEFPENPAVIRLKNTSDVIGQEAERMADVVRKIGEVTEFKTRDYVGGAKIMDLDRARSAPADENLPVWRSLFQQVDQSAIVFGEDTVIRLANPAAVVLAGENPVGKSFTRYLRGIEHTKAMASFEKLSRGEAQDLELEMTPAQGPVKKVLVKALPMAGSREFLALSTDVTAQRKLEQEMRSLSAFYDQLIRNATLPLVAMDIDGKITFWNKAAEKLLGYTQEQVRGKLPDFLIDDFNAEEYGDHIRRLRREGDLAEELKVLTRDGKTINVYHVDTVMRDDAGNALGFLAMLFDYSERREFESQLKEKMEQIAVMSDITGVVRDGMGMEDVLEGALRNLSRVVPLDLCAVSLSDPEARDVMVIGFIPEENRFYRSSLRLYEDAEMVKKLLFMDNPTIFDSVNLITPEFLSGDVHRELDNFIYRGFKSLINFPLAYRGEVLGTLHLVSRQEKLYNQGHLDQISQLAGPIAMGLANMRLFNQIQRQNLELSQRTAWMEELIRAGQRIQMGARPEEAVTRLMDPYINTHPRQHITAWLVDSDDGEELFRLAAAYNYPDLDRSRPLDLDRGLVEAVRDRRQILELDLETVDPGYEPMLKEAKTAMIVPLTALDRLMGLFVLESHHHDPFTEGERVEILVLAAHVASSLRNLYFLSDLDLALRFQQSLIQDANALILILDSEGRVAIINRALQHLVGAPVERYLGRHFREFFERHLHLDLEGVGLIKPGDKKFNRLLRMVEKGQSLVNARATIFSEDGRESKAVFNTSSILDREGSFRGFIAIGQDMTRFEEIEHHLIQSEKMATMGQMSAGIAHDLNNPITGIVNCATMLSRNASLDDKAREMVQKLIEEARRIDTLAQNLMSYAKPSKEEMFPLDLRAVVIDSLSFTNYEISRARVTVETRLDEELSPIRGIRDQVQQVFINILSNASHACAEKGGGRITIEARNRDDANVEVRVSDTGRGILPQHMDRLFDPFFTTKPEGKGTGLGLLIVKEIIDRHQGRVDVESVPGEGATFTLVLPVYRHEKT